MRGKQVHGPAFTGHARTRADAESDRTRTALVHEYGIVGRVAMLLDRFRGGNERSVGITIAVER